MKQDNRKFSLKEFFDFQEVVNYFFRRNRTRKKGDINLRIMHGINKMAIIIFLIALLILIFRNIL